MYVWMDNTEYTYSIHTPTNDGAEEEHEENMAIGESINAGHATVATAAWLLLFC